MFLGEIQIEGLSIRVDGRHKKCPYLGIEKVEICEAQSKGLKVPSQKEIFEYRKRIFTEMEVVKHA